MNEIKIFDNPEFGKVRTMEINGEPYFVGKDVAIILGYAKPENAIANHVDTEDKTLTPIQGGCSTGSQNTTIINESGLYSLILSSKLPKAKEFKRWVTSEVLPSIRKHGAYAVDELLNDPEFAIKTFTALKEERAKNRQLTDTVAIQNQQIAELQPKASYYDVVLNCKDVISISKISKDYGKSAQWLNEYLHKKKVQFKQGDIWLLYEKYADKGYTHSRTHIINGKGGKPEPKMHTYWTQKGRLFIYDLLKSDGIVPLIERERE